MRPFGDTLSVDEDHPDRKQGEAARIRVVLADDSVLLREGIASLLEGKGFETPAFTILNGEITSAGFSYSAAEKPVVLAGPP